MLQRSHPLPVTDTPVRSMDEQFPHDLGVDFPSVAENHGFQECGPAQVIDVIHVDPGGAEDLADECQVTD
nr:hypothetical protein [Deinococcus malanensis]